MWRHHRGGGPTPPRAGVQRRRGPAGLCAVHVRLSHASPVGRRRRWPPKRVSAANEGWAFCRPLNPTWRISNRRFAITGQQSPRSSLTCPRLSTSPLFTLHSPVGSFLFSYTMAAVILGLALLAGWTWKISRDQQVVQDARRQVPESVAPEMQFVGRITGAVDCRWTDPATKAFDRDAVPLGRKYVLAAGFMEITYDSGAKVILQGPATYEVESASGGFLSLGKLTARVEGRAEGGRRRAEGEVGSGQWAVGGESEIRNPKSEIFTSPSTPQRPLSDRGSKGERTASLSLAEKSGTNHFARPSPLRPLLRSHSHRGGHRPGHRVRRRGRSLRGQPGAGFPWQDRVASGPRRQRPATGSPVEGQ